MRRWVSILLLLCVAAASATAWAADPVPATAKAPAMSDESRQAAVKLIDGGIAYLLSKKEDDGGWSLGGNFSNKPAVTAMVLKALLGQPGADANDAVIHKGLDVLLSFRQKDGGIYNPKEGQENYTTAVAVMALVAAKDAKYRPAIDDAVKYMRGLQIVPGSESPDGQKITDKHPFVGGVSYGRNGRPDLSNVGYWLEAMHEAGVKGDDPDMQRALVFVTNTQNRSESNPQAWARAGTNDGGFVYTPARRGDANQGESAAADPNDAGGVLRSYGSMTYTGFKSMLYAAVDRKDDRVQAALKWIESFWRLDSNPNMPTGQSTEGLYYYYQVFAKAMEAWGEPVITDVKGQKHNWREELVAALKERAKADGSWENESGRWFEKLPLLSTCYAVLSLQEAMRD